MKGGFELNKMKECNNWMCSELQAGECGLEAQVKGQAGAEGCKPAWRESSWRRYIDDVMKAAIEDNCPYLARLKKTAREVKPKFTPSEPEGNQAQQGSPGQKY